MAPGHLSVPLYSLLRAPRSGSCSTLPWCPQPSSVSHQPSQCPWHPLRSAVFVLHSVLGFCVSAIFESHGFIVSESAHHLGGCQHLLLRRFWLCGFMSDCTKGPQVPGGLGVTLTKMTWSVPMPVSLSPSLVSKYSGSGYFVPSLLKPSVTLFSHYYRLIVSSFVLWIARWSVVMPGLTQTWMAGELLHHVK